MGIYSYIKGTIIDKGEDKLVIENSGIGYEIICPYSISSTIEPMGDIAKVWIYQSVREDDVTLYGFSTPEMKDLFLSLIEVSGIGPKVAQSICSQVEPDRFALAVIGGDVSFLTSVKGVGKKGAERIVVELKDKLKKAGISSGATSGKVSKATSLGATSAPAEGGVLSDAVEALIVLGYKENVASEAVSSNYEDGISLQELIKKSLKSLAR
ncbi:MAG: Holliday junction branch migration protein RuvA [Clostridiales bacterium]|nr:Holliday junction branch migration protein RuvA [Clostridiales bacterium]